jgi:hypothetical protein
MSAASPPTVAPDPSPNMTEQGEEAVGFFKFPRGLRDKVYDMAREEYHRRIEDAEFEFRAAIRALRLISRQFKSEYDQRSAVNTFVRVLDPNNMCTIEHFPRLALKSCYLEVVEAPEFDDGVPFCPGFGRHDEFAVEIRLAPIARLLDHLPEVKDVHIQLVRGGLRMNLRDIAAALIAYPFLTSFSIESAGSFITT